MYCLQEILLKSSIYDSNDRFLIETTEDICSVVIVELQKQKMMSPLHNAAFHLVLSNATTFRNIWMLSGAQPTRSHLAATQNDLGALLRRQCDSMIQYIYILHGDPIRRSQRFMDQFWIDKNKSFMRIFSSSSNFAKEIQQSPNREFGELQINQNLDRIEEAEGSKKFLKRLHWFHPKNLETIAEEIGLKDEYDFYCNILNGPVHSSALSVTHGIAFDESKLYLSSLGIVTKVLLRTQEVFSLPLSSANIALLNDLQSDLLNFNSNEAKKTSD